MRVLYYNNNRSRKEQAMSEPKYPDITVRLVGEDGNAFAIMGRVSAALRDAGVSKEEQEAYFAESTAGDYDHLLRTAMAWVSTE
jgi:hypothetical protein